MVNENMFETRYLSGFLKTWIMMVVFLCFLFSRADVAAGEESGGIRPAAPQAEQKENRSRVMLGTESESGSGSVAITRRVPSLEKRTYAVEVDGDNVYLAVTSGLIVLNAANAPKRIGGLVMPDSGNGLALSRNRVFMAQGNYGLAAVDVTRPEWPRELSRVKTPGSAQGVALQGKYAFVADGSGGLQVVDVGNPSKMRIVAGIDTGGYAWAVAVRRGRAYVAAGHAGVAVVDVRRPRQPRLETVIRLDGRETGADDVKGRAGARGIQARDVEFGSRNLLYIAAGSEGLIVVETGKQEIVGRLKLNDFARGVGVWSDGRRDTVAVADGQAGVALVAVDRRGGSLLIGKFRTRMAVNNVTMGRRGKQTVFFLAHDADGLLLMENRKKDGLTILAEWPGSD